MPPDQHAPRRGRRFGGGGRSAVVIGRWGDDTALLRLEDGTTLEAPVPEPLRELIDVGTKAAVADGGEVEWDASPDPAPAKESGQPPRS